MTYLDEKKNEEKFKWWKTWAKAQKQDRGKFRDANVVGLQCPRLG